MERMIRKQIYIGKAHDALLKRLAAQRGVSEAAVIRQAIEQQINMPAPRAVAPPGAAEAWQRILAFLRELQAQGPIPDRPRDWKREDLYEERLSRYARNSD